MNLTLKKQAGKNMAIGLLLYIIVPLALIRVFEAKDWEEFQHILSIPTVWIVLLVGFIVCAILMLLFQLRLNALYSTGIALFLIGAAILIFYPYIPQEIREKAAYDIVNFGVGGIGVGVGIFGIGVATESSKMVATSKEMIQSIANLEFYEKIAMLDHYMYAIGRHESVVADRIYHDIKGAMELKKYVDPEIDKKLKNRIDSLIDKIVEGNEYEELHKRLRQLREEDC